jgi:hypothetical protein
MTTTTRSFGQPRRLISHLEEWGWAGYSVREQANGSDFTINYGVGERNQIYPPQRGQPRRHPKEAVFNRKVLLHNQQSKYACFKDKDNTNAGKGSYSCHGEGNY